MVNALDSVLCLWARHSTLIYFCFRINSSKKTSTKKSRGVVSTTTYSSKSMSCCSVCGSYACSSDHALSTIKSMSLCHSLTDEDNLDQLSLDDFGDEPQVSQPHNSTLNEEDCHLELKDLIPQDLSAIIGRLHLLKCFRTCEKGKYTLGTILVWSNLGYYFSFWIRMVVGCKLICPCIMSGSSHKFCHFSP